VRTVQGELESVLGRLFRREVEIDVAGRTDAGVHALGQVVGVPGAPDDIVPARLRTSLNGICGPSIAVSDARAMPDGWHARFSARSRSYVYAILASELPDPFLTRTTWHHRDHLDVAAMNEAAGHLLGEHDFTSFGRLPEPDAPATRTLFELSCRRSGSIITVKARANAFIQQMVRSLVGTLVHVGAGKIAPDVIPQILAARDRSVAGPVAPPQGLCLVAVEYDEGWSHPFDPVSQARYPA